MMRLFGATVQRDDAQRYTITPQRYAARAFAVEPDASSASYFFAAAAAAGGRGLGQEVRESEDGREIIPQPVRPAVVETHGDHRIAMAFAVAGLRANGIAIANPECVTKTFPDFFRRLEALVASER